MYLNISSYLPMPLMFDDHPDVAQGSAVTTALIICIILTASAPMALANSRMDCMVLAMLISYRLKRPTASNEQAKGQVREHALHSNKDKTF